MQALATATGTPDIRRTRRRGADFLYRQQVLAGAPGFREAYRTDPTGGWCLGRPWQGWPLIDCTAEAALGVLVVDGERADAQAIGNAVGFILRGQNRDGGFASYEARRCLAGVEWFNSSEMFTDAMNEKSFVECTTSCIAALAACRKRLPGDLDQAVGRAIARGAVWLRRRQASDGSWMGNWGVHFIYGTLFGIRGLVAAGAGPGDPALASGVPMAAGPRQRGDGGWGEHHSGCVLHRYVPNDESQVLQTAWALTALLEAQDPDWGAQSRAAQHLADMQNADGSWPNQGVAGVFGRTGLLDYTLYRQYFPLHALGLYEQRRRARTAYEAVPRRPPAAASAR